MLELFTYLAAWLTYDVLVLDRGTKRTDAVHFFIDDGTRLLFAGNDDLCYRLCATVLLGNPRPFFSQMRLVTRSVSKLYLM